MSENQQETSVEATSSEPMSSSYADGLSPYEHKGKLGLQEVFDSEEEVDRKVAILAGWMKEAKHVVCHTGAGISTSAGIPDFRGPQGVWTLEAKGLKPKFNKSFNEVEPTKTHMAIKQLIDKDHVKFVVSQNIDGLHLRSGIKRQQLAELHGNMFTENCSKCDSLFVRSGATTSVGCKELGKSCPGNKGRLCRGKIKDTILDWEHNLPEEELEMAEWHSNLADLNIALGTTMQIIPSGNLPLRSKRRGGKLVVCNLQPTKHDKKADLVINTYVDQVMERLLRLLELDVQTYKVEEDPTKKAVSELVSWDFPKKIKAKVKREYLDVLSVERKRTKEKSVLAYQAKKLKKEAERAKEMEEDDSSSDDVKSEPLDSVIKGEIKPSADDVEKPIDVGLKKEEVET